MPRTRADDRCRIDTVRARNERRCRDILDTARPLQLDDLDWCSAAATEIDPAVVDCLVYMRDVEGFTDRELSGFTANRTTLADPVIARFLDVWREEERGHADALDRFLESYRRSGATIPSRQLPPTADVSLPEKLAARVGGPVGSTVATAHMSWGAANELLTLNGYRVLAGRCRHPMLSELLSRIVAQEARHFSFYLLQAQWRLYASRFSRFLLAQVLDRAWTPVGVGEGYKTEREFARVLSFLAEGEDGARIIERMDARFSALPGFERLRIFSQAADDASRHEQRVRPCTPHESGRSAGREMRVDLLDWA